MPSVNQPEKIAGLYLRLNGFLHLPLFTVFFEDGYGQIDYIALRAGNSVEKAGGVEFIVDDDFFKMCISDALTSPRETTFGIVAKVRGNKARKAPDATNTAYARKFLGELPVVRVSFCDVAKELRISDGVIVVSIKYAWAWIHKRITWMDEQGWKFTKSQSWALSDDFLSDLLYQTGRDWKKKTQE